MQQKTVIEAAERKFGVSMKLVRDWEKVEVKFIAKEL